MKYLSMSGVLGLPKPQVRLDGADISGPQLPA